MRPAFLNVQQYIVCIFPCRSIKIRIIIFNSDTLFHVGIPIINPAHPALLDIYAPRGASFYVDLCIPHFF